MPYWAIAPPLEALLLMKIALSNAICPLEYMAPPMTALLLMKVTLFNVNCPAAYIAPPLVIYH